MSLGPKAMNPKLADEEDWKKACGIVKEKLPGYRQIYIKTKEVMAKIKF